ncbi:MAG: DUF3576 domain-containing protein, partial [Pseudomonadota bacterium]
MMFHPDTSRLVKILGIAALAAALAACANTGSTTTASVPEQQYGQVNKYLWTASLETMDFMPLDSVDPQAGVILTDWFASTEVPNERFRTNVLILGNTLRADALRVRVFKQVQSPSGSWVDAPINPNTEREVENAILTRAREIRLNSLS